MTTNQILRFDAAQVEFLNKALGAMAPGFIALATQGQQDALKAVVEPLLVKAGATWADLAVAAAPAAPITAFPGASSVVGQPAPVIAQPATLTLPQIAERL